MFFHDYDCQLLGQHHHRLQKYQTMDQDTRVGVVACVVDNKQSAWWSLLRLDEPDLQCRMRFSVDEETIQYWSLFFRLDWQEQSIEETLSSFSPKTLADTMISREFLEMHEPRSRTSDIPWWPFGWMNPWMDKEHFQQATKKRSTNHHLKGVKGVLVFTWEKHQKG